MFGPHLIIDGTRCDTSKLADRNVIEQLLSDYPAAIGMTKIGGPYMFEYQAPDPAYSGVSGIVVIAESHIAIHTFPALDYFTMDIFSCKNFDHEKAIQYIKEALDVREMDRMLVQRGLSFRGPHHGKYGATDELIEAAEQRLARGIISNETAGEEGLVAARDELAAHRAEAASSIDHEGSEHGGRMIWPQYGVTPDVGTYGAQAPAVEPLASGEPDEPDEHVGKDDGSAEAACEPCARDGARIVPLNGALSAPLNDAGIALPATEPLQVNPTASISGLLDRLGGVGMGGRALSRALAEWERMARDPDCTIALALSTPVVAAGMRELLVYAVEHRYIDIVVAADEDIFADLHEALGHYHYVDNGEVVVTEDDRSSTARFIAAVAKELGADESRPIHAGWELLRALGEYLPRRAPRKGLLQAAAKTAVPIYVPDLLAGPVGAALLAARADGAHLRMDPLDDLAALAGALSATPRLGTIHAGRGLPESYLTQACAVAGGRASAQAGAVYFGAARGQVPDAPGVVAVESEPLVALPLVVSGLAQRIPAVRGRQTRAHAKPAQRASDAARDAERVLA